MKQSAGFAFVQFSIGGRRFFRGSFLVWLGLGGLRVDWGLFQFPFFGGFFVGATAEEPFFRCGLAFEPFVELNARALGDRLKDGSAGLVLRVQVQRDSGLMEE